MAQTRTFADMLEVMRQHEMGLVSTAELILALQCDEHQVKALVAHCNLPLPISNRSTVADWDSTVESWRVHQSQAGHVSHFLDTMNLGYTQPE